MDKNGCIFPQCQVAACDATVLLGGPYCDKHKPARSLSKPTITAVAPGQRQPSSQSFPQSFPQSSRNPNMDPHQKTGDAITVKTPLPALQAEKKQLPNTKTARKTTASVIPKPQLPTTASWHQDSNRPIKRPRLNAEITTKEKGTRHGVPVLTHGSPYASPQIKAMEEEISAVSGFSLHPRKQPIEAPTHGQRAEQSHVPKLPQNRRSVFPVNNVIDLTGDDEPEPHQSTNSYPNGQKGQTSSSIDATNQTIEVQFSLNQVRNFAGQPHTTVAPNPNSRRSTPVNIAPRPNPPLPTVKPLDPSRQNVNQVRHDLVPNTTRVAGVTGTGAVTGHLITSHHLSSTSVPSTSSAYGEPRVAESKPRASSEQVRAYIQEVLQRCESRGTDFYASLHQARRASPLRPPQRQESPKPSTSSVQEQKAVNSYNSIYRFHPKEKPTQPFPREPEHVEGLNGKVPNTPNGKPSLASMFPNRTWKSLNPEERRQVYIAQHDPKKFDEAIYGKLNEPYRPGSALFGLPEYKQPPRPVRPATHFAHIDPRVYWKRPRSSHVKQDEIRERGNRKSRFGRAAATAARRKQKDEEDGVSMDLPERVKSNPAWLAAVDELDQMAHAYHAQRRGKARQRAPERKENDKERVVNDSDGQTGSCFTLSEGAMTPLL
ncbi:hypothetical protein GGR53DRAFT_345366 [Hypoxylon sp. FL1150]|nr:hypothetical protein GGR53DRAFT_345366 [Hypoxylon sp. FL1150]